MNKVDVRKVVKRVWIWVVILTVLLCLWPIEYRITRLLLTIGVIATWSSALFLWWQAKPARVILIVLGCLPLLAACLPGRTVDPDRLATDYSRCLRFFRGVRYVWGGEGLLGIDCSGLVRKGLVWGQLCHGVRTLNGRPIRAAITLWWHDSSARALRDGHRGWTAELFRHESVSEADASKLKVGDLAVTADGVHVMAYLGDDTWIEADPDAHKVIEVALPTDNRWFGVPVIFLRWRWLDGDTTPNQSRQATAPPRLDIDRSR